MARLPKYAQGAVGELVRVLCKGQCRAITIHLLLRDSQTVHDPKERYAGCTAECLKCGKIAVDNYNFLGSP